MAAFPPFIGVFEGVDRYTFRIGIEGDHCLFRDLRIFDGEENQETVMVMASLKDLNSQSSGSLTAVPRSGAPSFTATEIYKRISDISLPLAHEFGFKDDVQVDAPLRLIHRDIIGKNHDRLPSFIALSYCWHNPSWSTISGPSDVSTATNFSWPISKAMVKGLILERSALNEGIWIDQCCINQDDPQEKSRTIGFMNRIYAQARVVVVALEDVFIDRDESAFLEDLMQRCSDRGSTELSTLREQDSVHRIVRLASKLFSARWFTRAWCNHELLVSKNHIFLVRVNDGDSNGSRVLRITLLFLNSLVNVITSYDYTGAMDPHHSELMAQFQRVRQRGFLHTIFNPFGLGAAYNLNEVGGDLAASCQMKSPLETLRNLSKYGATVAADKIAITLNIVGSELYYKGPQRPESECGLLLAVIALAAGDPAVLCCSGKNYRLPDERNIHTWIQRAENLDFAGIAGKQGIHRRLDYVPYFTLDQITMDFFHVVSTPDACVRRASAPFLTRARWYMDRCIELSDTDSMFQLGGTFAIHRETKIQVLACALECGPQWINEAAAAKTSADYPDFDLGLAVQVLIIDADMGRSFYELTEEHREMYEFLTDFIETLTLDYVSPIGIQEWGPAWVNIGPGEMDRVLFMSPAGGRKFTAMIPTLLQHAEYTNCKRIFLLEDIPHERGMWTILGKSLIFGIGLDVLDSQPERLRKQQVIRA